MLTREQLMYAQVRACEYLDRVGIVLAAEESNNIEVADFGLDELETTGLELVVYVNTERVCAKELVLFPHQSTVIHQLAKFLAKRKLFVVAGAPSTFT